jgi:CBS domain-containing protein
MKGTKVRNARKLIKESPTIITRNTSLKELVLAFGDDPTTRSLYVINSEGIYEGIITLNDLVRVVFFYHLKTEKGPSLKTYLSLIATKAHEIMSNEAVFAKDDEDLDTVLNRMFENEIQEIPIVDDRMKIIGEINLLELLIAWLEKSIVRGEE